MPNLAAPLSHIVRDAQGVAWVDETNVKVMEIALDHLAYGWSADALHEQFPHLTLGQINALDQCTKKARRRSDTPSLGLLVVNYACL